MRKLREAKKFLLREVEVKLSLYPAILSKIEQDKRMSTKERVKSRAVFYKDQKNKVIIAWLSEKLVCEVKNEALALQAMHEAEDKIKYLTKKTK